MARRQRNDRPANAAPAPAAGEGARDELERLRKKVKLQSKIIAKAYGRVTLVVDGISDDGDRLYFGSSNDADILRDLRDEWSEHKIMGTQLLTAEQEATAYRKRAVKAETDRDRWFSNCRVLLANIDWLADMTGESPEDEDGAMLEVIRAEIAQAVQPVHPSIETTVAPTPCQHDWFMGWCRHCFVDIAHHRAQRGQS